MWALPATVIGLLVSVFALPGGRVAVVDGIIEAHGPLLRWALRRLIPIPGGAVAITFGHVVVARSVAALHDTRGHERVHVRQYERWGLLFLPAYLVASAVALARGGDGYFDNRFEREARKGETAALRSAPAATRASHRAGIGRHCAEAPR
jgi:hypothetical protein